RSSAHPTVYGSCYWLRRRELIPRFAPSSRLRVVAPRKETTSYRATTWRAVWTSVWRCGSRREIHHVLKRIGCANDSQGGFGSQSNCIAKLTTRDTCIPCVS